ncbi:FAD:protein FMN transferase [Arthrobacter sp. OVS8]|nr:FAD:protein FMN transferase [Arthrobacter sp. OVS8]
MQPTFKPLPAEHPAQSANNLSGPALKSRTFRCMGTVISLALPAGAAPQETGRVLDGATAAVERVFASLDEMFSLYRPDSESSRLARGEVTLRDASAAFRARFADATGWRLLTEGFFTPERPDGVLDLSGIIKGYAIDQAATALQAAGIEDWCLNAGGDVLVSGSPAPGTGSPWLAGVVDPLDRGALLSGFPWAPRAASPRWRRPVRLNAATTFGGPEWAVRNSGAPISVRRRWRPRTLSRRTSWQRPSSPAEGPC